MELWWGGFDIELLAALAHGEGVDRATRCCTDMQYRGSYEYSTRYCTLDSLLESRQLLS